MQKPRLSRCTDMTSSKVRKSYIYNIVYFLYHFKFPHFFLYVTKKLFYIVILE